MLPIVAALAGGLMKNGLGLLSKVIQKKGKDFIEKKTGVDLSSPDLTEEQLLQLKQYEMNHEEELLKLAIEEKELELKHEKVYLEDVQDARDLQKESLKQSDVFSKRFIYYYAIAVTILTFIYIFWITFGKIPPENVRFADTILGFCIGSIISVIINFFYGSSQGSKKKDEIKNGIIDRVK